MIGAAIDRLSRHGGHFSQLIRILRLERRLNSLSSTGLIDAGRRLITLVGCLDVGVLGPFRPFRYHSDTGMEPLRLRLVTVSSRVTLVLDQTGPLLSRIRREIDS